MLTANTKRGTIGNPQRTDHSLGNHMSVDEGIRTENEILKWSL